MTQTRRERILCAILTGLAENAWSDRSLLAGGYELDEFNEFLELARALADRLDEVLGQECSETVPIH